MNSLLTFPRDVSKRFCVITTMFSRAINLSRGSMARVCRSFATEGSGASAMKLSLCTPHETIYHDKVIDKVILPGEQGEYGVTVGHSPIISQLKPGVVSVIHEGVSYLSMIMDNIDLLGGINIICIENVIPITGLHNEMDIMRIGTWVTLRTVTNSVLSLHNYFDIFIISPSILLYTSYSLLSVKQNRVKPRSFSYLEALL